MNKSINLTIEEAIEKKICRDCNEAVLDPDILGLCENCFDVHIKDVINYFM